MSADYDNYQKVMDRRYGDALCLSADYAGRILASAIGAIASASGVPPSAALIAAKVSAVLISPEVVAATVVAQAQIFSALSAANDAASNEQMFFSAFGDVERAIRSLDRR